MWTISQKNCFSHFVHFNLKINRQAIYVFKLNEYLKKYPLYHRQFYTKSREKHNSRQNEIGATKSAGDTSTRQVWFCKDPHGSAVGVENVHLLRTLTHTYPIQINLFDYTIAKICHFFPDYNLFMSPIKEQYEISLKNSWVI